MKLLNLSAQQLLKKLKNKQLTSVELCKAYINQKKKYDKNIQAWEYFNEKKLLSDAKKSDNQRKKLKSLGVLHGLPVALKDIISTSEMPTKYGARIKLKKKSNLDAKIVELLKKAGAIIMGKTVTCELAFLSPSKTKNPHDYSRTPGGSSSGSAAVIASHMAPLSIGTQTGGSVIRPASYCGVVGYKPTYGLISRNGVLQTSYNLDQVGVFGKTVSDVELLSKVLFARDDADEITTSINFLNKKIKTKKSKFVFYKTKRWRNVDSISKKSFNKFILNNKKIVKVETAPKYFEDMIDCHTIIYETEMAQNFHHYYKTSKGKLSVEIKKAIINGLKHSAKDYALALDSMRTYSKNLGSIFERFDAIITPSSCGIADKGFKTTGSPEFNKIWSLAHVPCISLPILKGEKDLPLGLQIIGKQFEDLSMLRLAKIFEN